MSVLFSYNGVDTSFIAKRYPVANRSSASLLNAANNILRDFKGTAWTSAVSVA